MTSITNDENNDNDDLVSRWLTAANLAYAIPNFQMAGIVSPRSFAELELSYFEPLGVTKPDDRKRLFYLIQKVKGEIEKQQQQQQQKTKSKRSSLRSEQQVQETFQSPVNHSKHNATNNVGNHVNKSSKYQHDGDGVVEGGDHDDDYDDVIVSTTVGGGSDTISPVTLSSQIASLSEEIPPHPTSTTGHYQNHDIGSGRITVVRREKKAGAASKSLSVSNEEERGIVAFNRGVNDFETNDSYPPTAPTTTTSTKKKLTAREQLERELELRASKRREQKLMDQQQQQQQTVRKLHHQDRQDDDIMKYEEMSTTKSITTTSTAGGGSKKRRQSFLPPVRSTSSGGASVASGGGGGSNSSIVDVRSRRSSVGIHRRETVRKTNTTLSAGGGGRRGVVVAAGRNEEEAEMMSEPTSDLSASVASTVHYSRKSSSSVSSTIGISTMGASGIASASSLRYQGSGGGGGGGGGDDSSSVHRMDENRNGNVAMKDGTAKKSSLAKGAGSSSSGMKSSTASHSSRTKRLSTIPSSMIAPLSPLVEFSSTQLDESMTNIGPRNHVRRRSSIGGMKTPSSATHGTSDSAARALHRIGGGDAKSPDSTTSSTSSRYPSSTSIRPSSRTSIDGSLQRGNTIANKLNVSQSSVLSSSSSVASSTVRRRRQHLMSPTSIRGKDQSLLRPSTTRSKSPTIPSSSHGSVRSYQQKSSAPSTNHGRTSPMTSRSYATTSSSPPKRDVSPKKKLSPPKSDLLLISSNSSSSTRRILSPNRNHSPAMNSRAASPMTTSSTRRGVKSPIYDVGDSVVAYHHSTVEETTASSWSAQIGRLRESYECQHAQYLATTNNHSRTDENEHDEMRIRVIVRKRPMSHRESIDGGEVDVVQPLVYHDYGRVLIHQPKTKLDLTKEVETTSFAFDNAFDENSNNIDIYEQAVQGLIPGLFRGKWASVFAYGQTGSGKTVREICHELQRIA